MFFGSSGQVRVLFDASKAEMASNADWVIDADKHNLSGGESNPQAIPSPAQSGVTSSTSETYWDGGISAWGIECVKHGMKVETLPASGKITWGDTANNAQDLSRYDIFIVDEPNAQFSTSEKSAIIEFVKNGGGLMMVADHDGSDRDNDGWDSPHSWNDLMSSNKVQKNPFGINFNLVNLTETSSKLAGLATNDTILHGTQGNVKSFAYHNGTTINIDTSANKTAEAVLYSSSGSGFKSAMVARAHYGKGRIVAIGDSSPTDDGTGDSGDKLYDGWDEASDGTLLVNATLWLAGNTTVTRIHEASLAKPEIRLFPNPAQSCLNISGLSMPFRYTILNQEGKIMQEDFCREGVINMNLSINGLYIIKIYTEEYVFAKTFLFQPR